jgi:hypothetical protein
VNLNIENNISKISPGVMLQNNFNQDRILKKKSKDCILNNPTACLPITGFMTVVKEHF